MGKMFLCHRHEEKGNWSTGSISELLKDEEAVIA